MRTVQTCILRLLIDPDAPGVLQGALQALPEVDSHPFVNEQALLKLLHDLLLSSSAVLIERGAAGHSAVDEKTEE